MTTPPSLDQRSSVRPIVTIVIPTYNRPDALKRLVTALLLQQDPRWRLLVIDNCSPVPAASILPPEVEVIRNSTNIGIHGNVIRCFERAETDWVWVVGDDDVPVPGGIAQALATIEQYPDAGVLNFAWEVRTRHRKAVRVFTTLDDYLANCDDYSAALWISTNIYSRRHYMPVISFAYTYAVASPHYAMTLMMLAKGIPYVALPNIVMRNMMTKGDGWNVADTFVFQTMVLDMPISGRQRRMLSRMMRRDDLKLKPDLSYCVNVMRWPDMRSDTLYLFLRRRLTLAIAEESPWLFAITVICGCALAIAPIPTLLRAIYRLIHRGRDMPKVDKKTIARLYRM